MHHILCAKVQRFSQTAKQYAAFLYSPALKRIINVPCSLRIASTEVVIEQSEEEEAESDGGDETEGLRLTEHGLEGGEEGGTVEIADGSKAQQQTDGDGDEGNDMLSTFTFYPLTFNAAQGDVGEV